MSNMERRSYIFPRNAEPAPYPFTTEPGGWLRDRDGDGHPDDCAIRLTASDHVSITSWGDMFDIAAMIGVQSLAIPESITADASDPAGIALTPADGARFAKTARETASSNPASSVTLNDLRDVWTFDGALVDRDGDLRSDGSRLRFRLPDPCPAALGLAAVDLAARLGVETTGVSLPLLAQDDDALRPGDLLCDLSASEDGPGTISLVPGGLTITGDETGKIAALRVLSTTWPRLDRSESIAGACDRLDETLREIAFAERAEWRIARLANALADSPLPDQVTLTTSDPEEVALARAVLGIEVAPGEMPGGFDLSWSAPWEANDAVAVVLGDAAPLLDESGEQAELLMLISEPPLIRQAIARDLQERFPLARVRVRSAYKAGLSWIEEDLIPALQSLDAVDRIALSYPPFTGEGHLDLRIRWLQEIYPGDELLAQALDLPLAAIAIDEGSAESLAYICRAFAGGNLLHEETFSPAAIALPYLSIAPDDGQVVASIGAVRVLVDGEQRFERIIEPDPLRFWRWYQAVALPRVGEAMAAIWGAAPSADEQPFFETLDIEITISEQDRPLGIREELDSPAEALHEDCYFGTLDWLHAFAEQRGVPNLHGPGAIRPFVQIRTGQAASATIRLQPRRTHAALVERALIAPLGDTPAPPFRVTRLSVERGDVTGIAIEIDSGNADADTRFLRLLATAASFTTKQDDGITLSISAAGSSEPVLLPLSRVAPDPLADVSPAVEMPGWRTILFNDDLPPLLATIRQWPGVHVWQPGRSYEGRPLWSVALTSHGISGRWSPGKLSARKPSVVIAARHHANEVSSTTAAFTLIEAVQRDRSLLGDASIVLIPVENPDGVAFHETLSAAHPFWKHHPARYNAVGLEYGLHAFNRATPFGEARVRREAWERWRPQMVIDNHGVPSHEWSQHFSGFGSPPRFPVSYWVPQALLYGIIDHIDTPEAETFGAEVQRAIARDLAAAGDLAGINDVLGDRYRRWGAERDPNHFPASYDDSFLCYLRSHPADPDSRNVGRRFPATTLLDWVTEVPDETAHGERLEQTARAHLLANLAAIRVLISRSGKDPRDSGKRSRTHRRNAGIDSAA